VTKGRHTPTRDKKARESQRDENRQPRESMHLLETVREGKVSKMSTGNRGKAHTN
jgi:hypothetical protein